MAVYGACFSFPVNFQLKQQITSIIQWKTGWKIFFKKELCMTYVVFLYKSGTIETYLLKPGTSQNDMKPAQTSQNNLQKLRNDPKRPKVSKLGKSGVFY